MEIYELKFKKKQSVTILGVGWGFISLFWVIFFVVFIVGFKPSLKIGTVRITTLIMLNIILGFVLGNYYITLSSRAYIKISHKELKIHKGLTRRNQVIKFEDIEEVLLIGEKIVIILMDYCSNKEVVIRSDLMYLKDLDILLNNFSKYNKLIKRL
ncbi:hypothetical protein [Clostridium estertheticum]|uniref:hypothetical protein n=1 Tax=Clostridium estertheticum TaxID=238834 RepID=UPI001C7D15F5|nr:hypothetical protein [Clostridium estertheticum]MBX4261520.1 hypothetical protein [Clostridium estertheticum]